MDHALLILGEPGSGKTITLLELARETILLAEKDSTQPIPVVFNLSSWAKRKLPVQVWLVEELTSKYQIPSWIGRIWVKQDRLMLGSFGVSRSYQHCQE
jgi:predicted NACHT family NTPase